MSLYFKKKVYFRETNLISIGSFVLKTISAMKTKSSIFVTGKILKFCMTLASIIFNSSIANRWPIQFLWNYKKYYVCSLFENILKFNKPFLPKKLDIQSYVCFHNSQGETDQDQIYLVLENAQDHDECRKWKFQLCFPFYTELLLK